MSVAGEFVQRLDAFQGRERIAHLLTADDLGTAEEAINTLLGCLNSAHKASASSFHVHEAAVGLEIYPQL